MASAHLSVDTPMTSKLLLEVCVDTPSGLLAAVRNGADRIELCAALSEGGLTPSLGLMKLAASLDVPVRAMIRPRTGDFCYSTEELAVMHHDIDTAAACNIEGVVLGCNLISGALDEAAIAGLVSKARSLGLSVALNRGFDLTPDPFVALDLAISLGVDSILTSGGERTAALGVAGLRALVIRASNRIEILAGSGVSAQNAADILQTGVTSFHASCRNRLPERHGQVTNLGYVSPDQSDTDGAMVADLSKLLKHLGTTHVFC